MIKYIKASAENKAEFVSNLGKFMSDEIPNFYGTEFHYIKPTEDNPVEILTTNYDSFEAKYGEYVRVIYRGDHLYDINVAGDNNWGIMLDVIKVLKNDF